MEYLFIAIIIFLSIGIWTFFLPDVIRRVNSNWLKKEQKERRRRFLLARGDTWELARALKNIGDRHRPSLRDYFELYLSKFAMWIAALERKHVRLDEEVDKLKQ